MNGHLSVVKLLIEKGNADWRLAEVEQTTPFHAAVFKGDTSITRYYIEQVGVDVTIKRNIEATAFHDVAVNGNLDILKMLVQNVLSMCVFNKKIVIVFFKKKVTKTKFNNGAILLKCLIAERQKVFRR